MFFLVLVLYYCWIVAVVLVVVADAIVMVVQQSEHIGQWATSHHLSDVRRGAPSWIWDYLAHNDVTIYV